jgi:flagellar hook protein FlgE
MSIFSTPLSGLNASSSALATISNNLANINTDGYKSQNTVFSDVFYQNLGTSGNNNPIQTGFGVKVEGTSINLTNGNVSSTGVDSNMALDGSGYFVTSDADGALLYTRSGDFTTNTSGQLITPGGDLVMGYPATGGVVNTNASLQAINVGQGASTASATTNFSMTTNLDASAAVGASYSPTPLSVYDSLGGSHLLSITYTKTSSDSWSYNVTVPSADIQNGTGTTTSLGSGTLTFDSSGTLSSPTGSLQLNAVGPFTDGAAAMSPTWELTTSNSSLLTQTASTSTSSAQSQNGYAAGTLSGYSVLADGTVQGTFSNGQTHAVGRVAVANFANPEGLQLLGNNQYQVTASSGQAVVGTAGTGGRGTIIGSSVEQSNVDVATQLSDLIVAQRSYEANAKAITTLDQIEQDTISMKSA